MRLDNSSGRFHIDSIEHFRAVLAGMGLADSGWGGSDFLAADAAGNLLFDPWLPQSSNLHSKPAMVPCVENQQAGGSSATGKVAAIGHLAISYIEQFIPNETAIKRSGLRVEIFDFWNPSGNIEFQASENLNAEDWGQPELPQFDPTRVVNPFIVPSRTDTREETASKRARWLLNLLGVNNKRRRSFARFFTEIFDEFPTRQTFSALATLVEEGISADDLRTACEFRIQFLAEAKWRLVRNHSKLSAAQPSLSDGIMGWSRAARWVKLCKGEHPSVYIDDAWIEDWHDLPSNSPDRWAFADYAEQRLTMVWNDILEIGFDSATRWVPSEIRQLYLPTGRQMRSQLGGLALPATGMLRIEKLKK